MVMWALGTFPGCGQLFSMTETRKDKDLNVVSALFSPCECRIPVFQHEFHTGRTSFSCCCNISFCILVCNGRISYSFVAGFYFFYFFFLFGLTLTVTDMYFAALSESWERFVALHWSWCERQLVCKVCYWATKNTHSSCHAVALQTQIIWLF